MWIQKNVPIIIFSKPNKRGLKNCQLFYQSLINVDSFFFFKNFKNIFQSHTVIRTLIFFKNTFSETNADSEKKIGFFRNFFRCSKRFLNGF